MIEVKLSNIDELRKAFDPAIVKKALDRAIGAAAARVRTQLSQDVRERYNIKASDIGKAVTLKAVNQDGVLNRLLVYTGGRISLAKFAVGKPVVRYGKRTGRPLPVRVKVLKANGSKVVPGGFFAHGVDSGTPLIFRRRGSPREMKKGNYIGQVREPIVAERGPAIPTMVANKAILAKVNDTATDVMSREFTRQMELLMSKTGAA